MDLLVNPLAHHIGRHLLEETKQNTYVIAIIVAASLVGALILGAIALMVFFKCCRSSGNAVHPTPLDKDVERGAAPQQQPRIVPALLPGTADAIPPWEKYGQKPPGALLAPTIPTDFMPYASNPRPPGAPPYERLLLVSSRVQEPMKIVEAALPTVGAVVYDWKLFSLQELLLYIKKVLGPTGKVTSIAVIAPGNKPGSVSLLEGHTTSADKLKDGGGELGQFWRVLAACVAANGVADGRRVDLLGCRVGEDQLEGAALLKALWCLTGVPFTASEDAVNGYQLTTFLEEPASGALSIIASTIKGIDLYFDRQALLGIQPAKAGAPGQLAPLPPGVYAPPLPAGLPPPTSLVPLGAQAAAAGLAAPVAGPKDIFSRFDAAVTAAGTTPNEVFTKYDKDGSGYLSPDEVLQLVLKTVPNSTALDAAHFASILDLDGNAQISLAEFLTTLQENKKVAAAVRTGRDDTALMKTLHEYLSDNDAIIRQYFSDADANKSGTLDHKEVMALVAQIPGLLKDEQRFIASYLYQLDTTGKGHITFDQLKEMVRAFGTPAAQAAVHTNLPAAPVALPAALPATAAQPTPAYAAPATTSTAPSQPAAAAYPAGIAAPAGQPLAAVQPAVGQYTPTAAPVQPAALVSQPQSLAPLSQPPLQAYTAPSAPGATPVGQVPLPATSTPLTNTAAALPPPAYPAPTSAAPLAAPATPLTHTAAGLPAPAYPAPTSAAPLAAPATPLTHTAAGLPAPAYPAPTLAAPQPAASTLPPVASATSGAALPAPMAISMPTSTTTTALPTSSYLPPAPGAAPAAPKPTGSSLPPL